MSLPHSPRTQNIPHYELKALARSGNHQALVTLGRAYLQDGGTVVQGLTLGLECRW